MKFDSEKMMRSARLARRVVTLTIVAVLGVRGVAAWAVLGGATRIGGVGVEFAGSQAVGWPGWCVGTLAALALAAGLVHLLRLLRRYEQGRPFSADTALHLRGFALALIASVLIERLLPPLLATFGASVAFGPPHLTVFAADLWALLTGGLLWLIAQVMAEAERISADNEQIV